MLRRIWLGIGLGVCLLSVNPYTWSAELTVSLNANNYDIYIGDIDNNGYTDFYFKAKPLFVLLHGDIATPLLIPKLGMDLMSLRTGNVYATPVSSTLTSLDVENRIQSNLLKLAQLNNDYIVLSTTSMVIQSAGQPTVNSFTYDALGRLINVTDTINGDRKYGYDAAGNRTQVSLRALGNRAPVAVNESITIPYQTTAYLNVLANDSDPDGDPISIKSFTSCGSASPSLSGTTGFNIYASYGPSTCSFTYTITDDRGAVATATVTVTVN